MAFLKIFYFLYVRLLMLCFLLIFSSLFFCNICSKNNIFKSLLQMFYFHVNKKSRICILKYLLAATVHLKKVGGGGGLSILVLKGKNKISFREGGSFFSGVIYFRRVEVIYPPQQKLYCNGESQILNCRQTHR